MTILRGPGTKPGDVVIHVESLEYCTKTVVVRNGEGVERSFSGADKPAVAGYPLIAGTNGADYNLALAGDEANVVALLMDAEPGKQKPDMAATTNSPVKFQALIHPPAIVNKTRFAAEDLAGDAFDKDAIEDALLALKFEVRSEPTLFSQQ